MPKLPPVVLDHGLGALTERAAAEHRVPGMGWVKGGGSVAGKGGGQQWGAAGLVFYYGLYARSCILVRTLFLVITVGDFSWGGGCTANRQLQRILSNGRCRQIQTEPHLNCRELKMWASMVREYAPRGVCLPIQNSNAIQEVSHIRRMRITSALGFGRFWRSTEGHFSEGARFCARRTAACTGLTHGGDLKQIC